MVGRYVGFTEGNEILGGAAFFGVVAKLSLLQRRHYRPLFEHLLIWALIIFLKLFNRHFMFIIYNQTLFGRLHFNLFLLLILKLR